MASDRSGRSSRQAVVLARRAVYAVGDIHGRADLLDELPGQIARDADQHRHDQARRLIFLGDYVDRGTASRTAIQRLVRQPLPDFAAVHLKGNHEQAMLDFLDGRSDGQAWLSYGGIDTSRSYALLMSSDLPMG